MSFRMDDEPRGQRELMLVIHVIVRLKDERSSIFHHCSDYCLVMSCKRMGIATVTWILLYKIEGTFRELVVSVHV